MTEKKCNCYTGYNGQRCENFDCDQLNNCNGNGVCIEPNLCKCRSGFQNANCSQFSCENLKYCSYNGLCDQNQKCICFPGWNGLYCDQANCSLLNACSELGYCVGPNECDCFIGFEGKSCELSIGENLNNPIFFVDIYYAEVNEFAKIGEKFLKVSAVDIDKGRNGYVRYKILKTFHYTYFDIDNDSGILSLAKPIFDVEENELIIELKAYDDGRPQKFSNVAKYRILIKRLFSCSDIINKTISKIDLVQNLESLVNIDFKPKDLVYERVVSYFLSDELQDLSVVMCFVIVHHQNFILYFQFFFQHLQKFKKIGNICCFSNMIKNVGFFICNSSYNRNI